MEPMAFKVFSSTRLTLPCRLPTAFICQQCLRSFTTTAPASAGHNKWSKTKHIKAVTDRKKMSDRTSFGKSITMYSKMYGENLAFNPQLANAIAAATKANVPKTVIENAIAKGQGRSASGAALEQVTLEVILPPNVALIIDIETDNRNRTLSEMKYGVIKKTGGVVGSTTFYFTRRGRVIFKAKEGGPTLSDMLEEAIEHDGIEDVEELPEGGFLAWTQPPALMAITEAFTAKFGLDVHDFEIIWAPNEDTKVEVDGAKLVEQLDTLLSGIKDFPEVKAIYANVSQGEVSDAEWGRIEQNIDL